MNKYSAFIYTIVGLLVGYFLYQYTEYSIYIVGIVLSFLLLNTIVLYLYQGFKDKSMALMKFMGLNFLKDILWALFWMYFIKDNAALAIFIAICFFLLSLPIYFSVLNNLGNNKKSDKNQS